MRRLNLNYIIIHEILRFNIKKLHNILINYMTLNIDRLYLII